MRLNLIKFDRCYNLVRRDVTRTSKHTFFSIWEPSHYFQWPRTTLKPHFTVTLNISVTVQDSTVTGRFATLPVRHVDVLWPGRFAPLDVSILGCFATSVDVSPLDDIKEVLTVSQITNFQTGGETSREVAKRPGIERLKAWNVLVHPGIANRLRWQRNAKHCPKQVKQILLPRPICYEI